MSTNLGLLQEKLEIAETALADARKLLADQPEPLMTIEDAAKYWRCTSQHVRNVISGKEWIGKVIRIGGAIRLQRKDVMSFGVEIVA